MALLLIVTIVIIGRISRLLLAWILRMSVEAFQHAMVKCEELIVRNGAHQNGQYTVVAVTVEGELHFSVIELECFHGQNLF